MTTFLTSDVSNVYDDAGCAILRAAHSPSGDRLIGVGGYINSPGDIIAWDTSTSRRIATGKAAQASLSMLAVSSENRFFATAGSSTDKVSFWSLTDYRHDHDVTFLPTPYRRSLAGHPIATTHISHMQFTPSGLYLLLSCWDCSVKIIDLRENSVTELTRHRRHNFDFVGISANEDFIVCGTVHEIQVWEFQSRTLRSNFSLDGTDLWSHIFLSNLNKVISVGRSGRLQILNLQTNAREELRLRYEPPDTAMAFSSSLGLLAIGQENGRIVLWDIETKRLTHRLSVDESPILSMDFAPDRPVLTVVRDSPQERVLDLRV